MFDLFHGNEKTGIISNVVSLVNADDPFGDVFEISNHPVVSRENSDGPIEQLKLQYCRKTDPYVLGRHITVESLSTANYKNKSLIQGRTLFNNAKLFSVLCARLVLLLRDM